MDANPGKYLEAAIALLLIVGTLFVAAVVISIPARSADADDRPFLQRLLRPAPAAAESPPARPRLRRHRHRKAYVARAPRRAAAVHAYKPGEKIDIAPPSAPEPPAVAVIPPIAWTIAAAFAALPEPPPIVAKPVKTIAFRKPEPAFALPWAALLLATVFVLVTIGALALLIATVPDIFRRRARNPPPRAIVRVIQGGKQRRIA